MPRLGRLCKRWLSWENAEHSGAILILDHLLVRASMVALDWLKMSGRNLLADNCSRPEFSGMQLVEIKIEVNAATIDSLETILLDLGVAGWSLLEDVIEKRAWIVGIFVMR